MKDYNIRNVVQDNKTEFLHNTDINFSETIADKNGNIAFDRANPTEPDAPERGKRKQRLYNRDQKQADTFSADTKTEQSADGKKKSEPEPAANVPFNRVKRFEQKAGKARAAADKAEQKLPHKTKIKRQRIFDEQKQKPKNRLQFEKEVRPQSDLYHRSPIKNNADTLQYAAMNKIHTKVAEVERDNAAVEAAHKTEQKTETLARYSVRDSKVY